MALQSTTIHRYNWLVKPVFPPSLSPAYTFSRISVSGVSLNGKHEKIRTGPRASLQLSRLLVSSEERKVRPTLERG